MSLRSLLYDRPQIVAIATAILGGAMFLYTHTQSLGFADQAEFALVTHLGSVPHPPGFPAYTYIGWLWGKILSIFGTKHVLNMVIFSVLSASMSLYFLSRAVYYFTRDMVAAYFAPLIFGLGATMWLWSNAVEVYAFHTFTFSMLLYGLIRYNINRDSRALAWAAVGFGLGIANHHLTTLLWLPFFWVFFGKNLFTDIISHHQRKIISWRELLLFGGITAGICIFFYGLMVFRANEALPFEFGSPNTFSRFWFHVAGGSWMQQAAANEVPGLIGKRFPYFIELIYRQYTVFLPVLFIGMIVWIVQKRWWLLFATFGYFLAIFLYQLRIYQFADTDAYMLLPFMVGSLWIAQGIRWLGAWKSFAMGAATGLLPLHILFTYPFAEKSNFNVSETLMHTLDVSAPKGSIVLLSDWTMLIQYHYYRIAEGFRPDLVVLKSGIKFTNYEMIPVLYPEFYRVVKPEYDAYIAELRKAHPEELYDSGATLEQGPLLESYKQLIYRIIRLTGEKNTPFLRDAGTYLFHINGNITTEFAMFSNYLFSSMPTGANDEFVRLPYPWLDSRILSHEPAAVNTLVDFRTMLEFYQASYRKNDYKNAAAAADAALFKVISIQNNMKTHLPFITESPAGVPE